LETEVTGVVQRTNDVKSVRFRRPKDFVYLPGQWAFLTVDSDEEQKTKPLSFSSSPTEDYLEFTKRLTGHEFSNAFAAMEMGDTTTIRGPHGKLTLLENHKKICMLSSGIGIMPLRSMIRYSTDKEMKTSIILLYSNRFEDAIAFMDDFDEMHVRNPELQSYNHDNKTQQCLERTNRAYESGDDREKVPDYAERVFYSCGHKPMVDAMVTMLSNMGLPEAQIKYEYFSGYLGAPGWESTQQ
jgi:ferredoxin-NADP reductase